MSLEGQSAISRFPYSPCDPLTFQQHAAHCFYARPPYFTPNSNLFPSLGVRVSLPHWTRAVSPSQVSAPDSAMPVPLFSSWSSAQLAGKAAPGQLPKHWHGGPAAPHPHLVVSKVPSCPVALPARSPDGSRGNQPSSLAQEMGDPTSSDFLSPPLLASRDQLGLGSVLGEKARESGGLGGPEENSKWPG